jgi:hypothetical protein
MKSPLSSDEMQWMTFPDETELPLRPDELELTPHKPKCDQTRFGRSAVPPSKAFILPRQTVAPFYQWQNNKGYCGEVSLIQSGLNNGQWISQYNARLLCGTGLSQAGPGTWCQKHKNEDGANYNAQLLLETPGTGVSGTEPFASAGVCLANFRLSATTYPYQTGFHNENVGLSGYKDFVSWIKREVISGNQVTLGVLNRGDTDPQYDHIVSVIKIGTNHDIHDDGYYDDDVLYFDDHGSYALDANDKDNGNPSVPYGASFDSPGCTPYVFAYSFGSLAKTRDIAFKKAAQPYSVVIPGVYPIDTRTGGDGVNGSTKITGHNYAFSVSGPIDNSQGGPFLKPIRVELNLPKYSASATFTNRNPNPKDPIAGWQYENTMIGEDINGNECTNQLPKFFMEPISLQIIVSELTPGVEYNLYEYDYFRLAEHSTQPALAVPTKDFNANKAKAQNGWKFRAEGSTYTLPVQIKNSDQIVIFRAVPASAP